MDHQADMTDERPYMKRELDEKFSNLDNRFDDQDEVLGNILEQTTKHNGRMKKIEALTKGIIMSGSVAIFMGGIIVGLVVYIYQYQLAQQSTRITNLKAIIQTLQTK